MSASGFPVVVDVPPGHFVLERPSVPAPPGPWPRRVGRAVGRALGKTSRALRDAARTVRQGPFTLPIFAFLATLLFMAATLIIVMVVLAVVLTVMFFLAFSWTLVAARTPALLPKASIGHSPRARVPRRLHAGPEGRLVVEHEVGRVYEGRPETLEIGIFMLESGLIPLCVAVDGRRFPLSVDGVTDERRALEVAHRIAGSLGFDRFEVDEVDRVRTYRYRRAARVDEPGHPYRAGDAQRAGVVPSYELVFDSASEPRADAILAPTPTNDDLPKTKSAAVHCAGEKLALSSLTVGALAERSTKGLVRAVSLAAATSSLVFVAWWLAGLAGMGKGIAQATFILAGLTFLLLAGKWSVSVLRGVARMPMTVADPDARTLEVLDGPVLLDVRSVLAFERHAPNEIRLEVWAATMSGDWSLWTATVRPAERADSARLLASALAARLGVSCAAVIERVH